MDNKKLDDAKQLYQTRLKKLGAEHPQTLKAKEALQKLRNKKPNKSLKDSKKSEIIKRVQGEINKDTGDESAMPPTQVSGPY